MDIFGGLFDFNMDGKTDPVELAIGMNIIHEEEKRRKREMQFGQSDGLGDLDELDDTDDN